MRICIQVGWKRTAKEGQKIVASVNGDSVHWDSFPGKWITPQSKRQYMMWHLCEIDAETGDRIEITCRTGLRGKGADENRSFDQVYVVGTEATDVLEFGMPGVGVDRYPVIKGRVEEVAHVTDANRRDNDVEEFLNQEF